MGDRTIEPCGNVYVEDVTNNFKCYIILNTFKKAGYFKKAQSGKKDGFIGLIYKSKPIDPKVSAKTYFRRNFKEVSKLKDIPDVVKPLFEIEGDLHNHVMIGGKSYWHLDSAQPYRVIPDIDDVLSSDWRYREDLIWLKRNLLGVAHKWKVLMEQQQRHERRLRQEWEKAQKKKEKQEKKDKKKQEKKDKKAKK